MTKKTEYDRGFNDGLRWAVTWLHNNAAEMNDPRARNLLNNAAFGLGVVGGKIRDGVSPGQSVKLQSRPPSRE